MGKAQSKRSVDITTEAKKGPEEEVTGKMEKIEDVGQKEINGDATPQEKTDPEKKEEEIENDKDLTTEKNSGDSVETNSPEPVESETPKDDANTTKDSAATEEISPLADESIKKSKKDKVKKKWSFRSISFGKKDKQKPAKTEESAETSPTAAVNGDSEKSPETDESVEPAKADVGAGGDAATVDAKPAEVETKAVENGVDEKQTVTNGDHVEKDAEVKEKNDDTNKTIETPAVSNSNITAQEAQTETKADADAEKTEVPIPTVTEESITNGNVTETIENGVDDKEDVEPSKAPEGTEIESDKTIPNVEEKPYQNGTNGDAIEHDEEPVAMPKRSQTEVKIISTVDTSAFTTTSTTNTTTTTTTLNTFVIETEETVGLTQVSAIDSSIAFPLKESSSDTISLRSSNANLHVDHERSAFQNTCKEQNTNDIKETEEKVNSISAVAISDNIFENANVDDIVKENDCVVEVVQTIEETTEILSNEEFPISKNEDILDEIDEMKLHNEVQMQQPPPLPASPPPSRVSVFAFKDNDIDFVEVSEREESDLEPVQQNTVVNILDTPSTVAKTESSEDFTDVERVALEENHETNEKEEEQKTEATPINIVDISEKPLDETSVVLQETNTETIGSNNSDCENPQIISENNSNNVEKINVNFNQEQFENIESIINEITEKAVEIVEQTQKEIHRNSKIYDSKEIANENTTREIETCIDPTEESNLTANNSNNVHFENVEEVVGSASEVVSKDELICNLDATEKEDNSKKENNEAGNEQIKDSSLSSSSSSSSPPLSTIELDVSHETDKLLLNTNNLNDATKEISIIAKQLICNENDSDTQTETKKETEIEIEIDEVVENNRQCEPNEEKSFNENVDIGKEINPMDLKENAAPEITQAVAVTSE